MLKLAKKDDENALKEFARTMIFMLPLVFMLILPWWFNGAIHWWPAAASGVLGVLYFVYPLALYYPYRVWMAIASVLGWVNTRIILGLAFYLLILPIGIVMRSLGKLQYKTGSRSKGTSGVSHWIRDKRKIDKNNLEKPF
ncbi:SxtJ family membrane protein [Paraglaciecola sp. MB-3u-78]|jgi:hypothetical protein|uniref:SxtJ family membrane protein n=1 Tax=Paraglaciecola sp. MB-3u-78 TaxID=2058332 RepID=UPI000C33480A|nr:SxtJ family membrane protein [Paraglaciecola sp. MB-3u-78]PKG99326.1 hypothetical protein CXF95_08710 [Paraglaciecola sp. MB-3u-78]